LLSSLAATLTLQTAARNTCPKAQRLDATATLALRPA